MKRPFLAVIAIILAVLLSVSAALAFSTLSLSKVDYASNDPSLGGSAWVLTVVENGNSEYATGTFTDDEIKRSDGAMSQKDLKIEIQNTQNQCAYSFQNSYTPIYRVEVAELGGLLSWYNTEAKCKAAYPNTFYYTAPIITGYCFVKTEVGKVTPLSTPATTFKSTIKASVGSETVTGDISSASQRSTKLGSRAFASWNGNLVSGETCPQPLDTGVMGASVNGQFLITDKAAYDRYNPDHDDLKSCLTIFPLPSGSTLKGHYDSCVAAYNAKTNAVITKTTNQRFASATVSNGQAVLSLPNLIQYPVITLKVRADWIGIFVPVGKPQLTSVTAVPFTEGNPGKITATIKNIGNTKASFGVSASCNDPAAMVGVSKTITLNPDETGTVDIGLSGSATGKERTTTCEVTAQDLNQPDNKDTKSVSITIQPLAICAPLSQRCNQESIETCNSDGTLWVRERVCDSACELQQGKALCADARRCDSDSQCDDANNATTDACVGTFDKQCIHTPITPPPPGPTIPFKLLGFGIGVVLCGILTYLLASNGVVWPAVGTGVLTLVCFVGVIIGVFATFSLLSAWMITIAMILLLVGIGLVEYVPSVALPCFLVAAILVVFGIMILYQCTDPGRFLQWAGVCS